MEDKRGERYIIIGKFISPMTEIFKHQLVETCNRALHPHTIRIYSDTNDIDEVFSQKEIEAKKTIDLAKSIIKDGFFGKTLEQKMPSEVHALVQALLFTSVPVKKEEWKVEE